uniref:Arabinogalactan peptide 16 n=1 Tax=Hordeum vulgare subsp. vulgare TaxID=112509 RepID=A0A8I6XA90_HORVV
MARTLFGFVAAAVLLTVLMPALAAAQAPAPVPTSDASSLDQGVAYLLIILALVLTYLIHPLDASSPYKLL